MASDRSRDLLVWLFFELLLLLLLLLLFGLLVMG